MFAKGPYLDVTDAFVKGRSIRELIAANIISKDFNKIDIPIDRQLYMHQEEAILKIGKGRNIVVSTGTRERVIIVMGAVLV